MKINVDTTQVGNAENLRIDVSMSFREWNDLPTPESLSNMSETESAALYNFLKVTARLKSFRR